MFEHKFIIPIFPLNIVIFPGIPLPLHIFEKRYISMINECREEGKSFGIIYKQGKRDVQIGCGVNVTATARTYDDGRMDIVTAGTRRFKISRFIDDGDILKIEGVPFEDRPLEYNGHDNEALEEGYRTLRQLIKYTDDDPEQEVGPQNVDPQALSFMLATSHRFSLPDKQKFLEMRSTIGRLQIQTTALKSYIAQLKREAGASRSGAKDSSYKFSLN